MRNDAREAERLPGLTLEGSRAMEQMARAAALLGAECDVSGIAAAITDQAVEFGAVAAHLLLVAPERRALRLAAACNIPTHVAARLTRVPFDAPSLATRAALTREPQFLDEVDLHRAGVELAAELAADTGARSVTSWPLIVHGEVLGVLTWLWKESTPSRAHARGTDAVCKLFASVLHHAVTRCAEVRAREQAEALHDAVLSLGAARSVGQLVERTAAAARNLARASTASIGLAREDGTLAPLVIIQGERLASRRDGACPQGMFETLLATPDAIFAEEVGTIGPLTNDGLRLDVGAFLGLPFSRCAHLQGFLLAGRDPDEEAFTADDQRALTQLLEHASTVCERILLDAELRSSEERFRLSIDNAPIGMALVGTDGRFLRVNQCLCEIVGYSPEELMKLCFQDITHPDDLEIDLELADRLRSGEIPRFTLEKRYLHREGHVVHVKLHASAVRGEDGEPLYGIAQIEDVSEDKRAEEERLDLIARVEAKHELLATVLESVPVGIALVRPSGDWALTNSAARRMVGRMFDIGEGPEIASTRLLHPDGRPVRPDELPSRRVFAGERVVEEDYLLRLPHGRTTGVRIRAAPVLGPSGETSGAVIVAEDIEASRQLERLRQEWISVVAHDLRQPISVIKLYAELGSRDASGNDRQRTMAIAHSVARLERMVTDLLDFAQVEARRLRIAPSRVDVTELVTQSVRTVDAQVSLCVTGEIPPVWADAERLEQILANLLSNAVKYRRPDTPIRVALGRRGDAVVVSVVNEGEGIATDEIDRLFDRFHRTRSARSRAPGLGLGLYITRGLVEAHGGRIWVQSVPGQTTAFHFSLPVPSSSA